MKIGIIGAGNIARRHAANLQYLNSVQVVAVCDLDESRARHLAQPFQASVYRQPGEMFRVQALDAILLCAPPTVRKSVFALAAAKGIHVFCEKPPADSVKTAEEISELIEASGIICSVDFHSRYSPVLPEFFSLTQGEPLSVQCKVPMYPAMLSVPTMQPWFFLQEKSGGHVMDQAIHTIDLLRYLVGEITEVHTLANNLSVPVSDYLRHC